MVEESAWRRLLRALLRLLGIGREGNATPDGEAPGTALTDRPVPTSSGAAVGPNQADEEVAAYPSQGSPSPSYSLRDDFLSRAEVSFFHILRRVVADEQLIFPKVRLADLVYPPTQEERQGAWNRISRKHVDFVL